MTAHAALALVCERNGYERAVNSIARRAYAGMLRSRATLFIKEQKDARGRKEQIKEGQVDLPASFWWAKGEAALTQDWDAGDFFTWIDREFEWQAFGVTFERSGIEAMLSPLAPLPPEKVERSVDEQEPQSALSVWPTDKAILAKMLEMIERGCTRDGAAKLISQEPGFERVTNEYARKIAANNLRRGRPRKSA